MLKENHKMGSKYLKDIKFTQDLQSIINFINKNVVEKYNQEEEQVMVIEWLVTLLQNSKKLLLFYNNY